MSFLKSPKIYLFAAISTAFILFAFSDNNPYFAIVKNMEIYENIYREINENYVDNIEPAGLMRTGINAMLKTLDPYTNYITEAQIETFKMQRNGAAGDIGVELIKNENNIVIGEIYHNLAAYKAKLLPGDVIKSINGKVTANRTIEEVRQALQGQPDTEVKLVIERPNKGELSFSVTRDKEEAKSIPYYGMIDKNTGYIKLKSFSQNCSKEVGDALKDMKNKNDLKSLIFDLRENPGGLLSEAVGMVNLFVKKGELVVFTKGKTEDANKEYKTLSEPIDTEIPVIVLINGMSASASEIVSGTLQDLDRGVILGTRSYGKGLVQQTKEIAHNSMLKLTVSKYYLNSGRCIQAIDYSGRYKDGSVKVPDSLRKEFKTKNGRKVLDGSGVDPDYELISNHTPSIISALQKNNLFFNFATQYHQQHEKIDSAELFKINDSDFNNFVQYLKDKKYDYTTQSEEVVKKIRQSAEKEKYSAAISGNLSSIEQKINLEKQVELTKFKEEVKQILRHEIASRYYYQRGKVVTSLDDDEYIKKALYLFSNTDEYNKLLKLGAKK